MRASSLFCCDRGLLDAFPDHVVAGPAGGRRGDGVGKLVAGDLEGALLRRTIPVRERAHLDVECDRLAPVVDAVRAVVRDAALDDPLVLVRASLDAAVRSEFRQ